MLDLEGARKQGASSCQTHALDVVVAPRFDNPRQRIKLSALQHNFQGLFGKTGGVGVVGDCSFVSTCLAVVRMLRSRRGRPSGS